MSQAATQAVKTLRQQVHAAMEFYFGHAKDSTPKNIYEMVIGEVERPLLKTTLQHTDGNQKLAAEILGLNRATLRKKLINYGLLPQAKT